MTAPAGPTAESGDSIPAAAAASVADLLLGPVRCGTVLGSTTSATWIDVSGRVVVLSGRLGVRLPNAVISQVRHPWPIRHESVTVGKGTLTVFGKRFRIHRWWQSRPVLPRVRPSLVRRAADDCARLAPKVDDAGIGSALARRDAAEVLHAAIGLLGRGDGLTPKGDDVVVGALAAYRLVGNSLGTDPDLLLAEIGAPLLLEARRRTTRLSASLIAHALDGAVATPVADLLRAVTGRGSLLPALETLHRVGHSSGTAMAHGALCGTRAALEAVG